MAVNYQLRWDPADVPPPAILLASSSGRYFVADGQPVFLAGDSGQTLCCSISIANVQVYLDARLAQGVNTVLCELVSRHPDGAGPTTAGGTGPANINGDQPWTTKSGGGTYAGASGTADFSTPKSAYWTHVDAVFAEIVSRGMVAIAYPLPWGFNGTGAEGFWPDLLNAANTSAVCNAFGQYLAGRYKDIKRLVWLDGSDFNGGTGTNSPDSTSGNARAAAIATGMRSAGALQLRSGDWRATSDSTNGPSNFLAGIQANGAYTYGGDPGDNVSVDTFTFKQARASWNFAPTLTSQGDPGAISAPAALPCFLKETAYDSSSFADGSRAGLRKQQAWAWLSGCTAGVIYGSEAVHHFQGSWSSHLSDATAADFAVFVSFVKSLSWHLLVPSELSSMRRLVTTSNGVQTVGASYVAAACASDGSCLAAFVPSAQSFSIDLRSLSGSKTARWYDPTTGSYTAIGTVNNTDSAHSFTTPGANAGGDNDWFLVLQ